MAFSVGWALPTDRNDIRQKKRRCHSTAAASALSPTWDTLKGAVCDGAKNSLDFRDEDEPIARVKLMQLLSAKITSMHH
jgi:hypothetical protein